MSKQAEVFFDSLSDDARVYLKKKKGEMQTEEALAALTHRLTSFLSYLEDNALLDITEDVTTEWIASLSHYADRTINNYICDVQGFLEFENIWRATHYFVPECIKQDDIYQPHFFSEDEKKSLLRRGTCRGSGFYDVLFLFRSVSTKRLTKILSFSSNPEISMVLFLFIPSK